MEKAHFGGAMAAGTKVSLETEFRTAGESSSEKVDTRSTKAHGTMVCSMAKVPNSSKMDNDTKEPLKRTNSTETECSIRMIRSSTESGKITNCQ